MRSVVCGLLFAVALAFGLTAGLHAQSSPPSNGFHPSVVAPRSGSTHHLVLAQWFLETGMLMRVSGMMNQAFTWPSRVSLVADECGESNATYLRSDGGAAIRLCYEFVNDVVAEFSHRDLTSIDRGMAQSGTVMFVILHEVGHALIDQFRLPAGEVEESAADQFAALILSSGDPMASYWAAEYWRQKESAIASGHPVSRTRFENEHRLSAGRFEDLLCWTYGADVGGRSALIRGNALPPDRATNCEAEYRALEKSWEGMLSAAMR